MIGYDNHRLNHGLLLDLTMEEVSGAAGAYIYDRAKPHHACLLHGGTIGWVQLASGLWVMDFTSATPDWIDCSAADTADLDFTTEDFSVGCWVSVDDLSINRQIMGRGLVDSDGWCVYVNQNGGVNAVTSTAFSHDTSRAPDDSVTIGNWALVGVSRFGTSVSIFVNGIDVIEVADTHADPLTSARELHIGIYDDETGSPWEGQQWRPRIWGSRALEEWEWLQLYNLERHWF